MARGQARLVVDLSDVVLVDSSGLAALVGGMKQARQGGGDLMLAGLQATVRIIFELTRLDRAFDIANDRDAAIAAFGA
jgi:anti-sigma B factor antagonist